MQKVLLLKGTLSKDVRWHKNRKYVNISICKFGRVLWFWWHSVETKTFETNAFGVISFEANTSVTTENKNIRSLDMSRCFVVTGACSREGGPCVYIIINAFLMHQIHMWGSKHCTWNITQFNTALHYIAPSLSLTLPCMNFIMHYIAHSISHSPPHAHIHTQMLMHTILLPLLSPPPHHPLVIVASEEISSN